MKRDPTFRPPQKIEGASPRRDRKGRGEAEWKGNQVEPSGCRYCGSADHNVNNCPLAANGVGVECPKCFYDSMYEHESGAGMKCDNCGFEQPYAEPVDKITNLCPECDEPCNNVDECTNPECSNRVGFASNYNCDKSPTEIHQFAGGESCVHCGKLKHEAAKAQTPGEGAEQRPNILPL